MTTLLEKIENLMLSVEKRIVYLLIRVVLDLNWASSEQIHAFPNNTESNDVKRLFSFS